MDLGWALDPMASVLVRRGGTHRGGGRAGVMQLRAKGHGEREDPFPEPPAGARPADTWMLDC